jgi:hypothetical protein
MKLAILCLALAVGAPPANRVLLLDNDELIEGDTQKVGNSYRIRRTTGELSIPAARVVADVADRNAAFLLLRQRMKANDPGDHVRLARWCLAHQLLDRAIEEAEAAAKLKAEDKPFRALVCEPIKRQAEVLATMPKTPPAAAPPAGVEPADTPSLDIGPESLALFVMKVQPILMNTCASCHAGDGGGKFKLIRTAAAGVANKHILQANLAAVSAFLNREQPGASALLTKAVSVHGNTGLPPIKDRQAAAYRHLEAWAFQAAGQPVPVAPPAPMAPATVVQAAPPAKEPMKPNEFASEAPPTPVVVGAPVATDTMTPIKPPTTTPMQPAKTESADPFDPAIFNGPAKPPKL